MDRGIAESWKWMSTGDDASLAAMRRTFAPHEDLRVRWQVAAAPAAGSELERADRVWPHLPFSEHVRQCLTAAWDHFDVVRLTIDAGRTFPTGLNGVLRGCLVSAAMALWLVGPNDSPVRDQRGLALTDEWYHRRIQYQRNLLELVDGEEARGQAQLVRLTEDRRKASALRTAGTRVQPTDIIDWAAAHQYGKNTALHRQALLEWQRLGGDAHALGWQLLMQDVQWGDGEGGPVEAYITARFANIAEPYLCSWHIFMAALKRFDELGISSL